MIDHTQDLTIDENHVYRYRGRAVPGVTTIMRPLYAAAYAGMPRERAADALARGTAVHQCVAAYALGQLYPDGYAGQLRAWAAFCRDFGFTGAPLAVETMLYSVVWGYAGTPDIVFDGVVIDVKSSETPCPITAVQTAAYAVLLRTAGVKITRRIGVALREDGSYDARQYIDDRNDLNTFKSLLAINRFIENKLGGGVK